MLNFFIIFFLNIDISNTVYQVLMTFGGILDKSICFKIRLEKNKIFTQKLCTATTPYRSVVERTMTFFFTNAQH